MHEAKVPFERRYCVARDENVAAAKKRQLLTQNANEPGENQFWMLDPTVMLQTEWLHLHQSHSATHPYRRRAPPRWHLVCVVAWDLSSVCPSPRVVHLHLQWQPEYVVLWYVAGLCEDLYDC